MTEKEHNKMLVEKYPFLIPTSMWTSEPVKSYDYSYTFLDDMPKGWKRAFGEIMCEMIKEELIKHNQLDKYRVIQVKEKFGQLCWYDRNATNEIRNIIKDFEYISSFTCINCGKLNASIIGELWISPFCEECYLKKHKGHGATSEDYQNHKLSKDTLESTHEIVIYKGDKEIVIKRDISEILKKIAKNLEINKTI